MRYTIYLETCILGIYLMLIPYYTQAQDPIFSHYYGNPMYLNPALTAYEGGTSIYGAMKNQWAGIAGASSAFNTQSVAVASEMANFKSGIGLIMTRNSEGNSQLEWKSIGLSYSFHALRNCSSRFRDGSELSFGFRATYNEMDVNFSQLIFSDQLDPLLGQIGPSVVSGLRPSDFLGKYYDLDAGMVYSGYIANYKIFYRLGFAINHLVNSGEVGGTSLPNEELAPRYTATLDLYGNRSNSIRSPEFFSGTILRYTRQASAPNSGLAYQVIDAGFVYIFNPAGPSLTTMLFHRWAGLDNLGHLFTPKAEREAPRTNSIGFQAGIEIPIEVQQESFLRLMAGYQYDYSGLQGATNGSWEVSLAVNLPKRVLFKCRAKCEYRKAPYPMY